MGAALIYFMVEINSGRFTLEPNIGGESPAERAKKADNRE